MTAPDYIYAEPPFGDPDWASESHEWDFSPEPISGGSQKYVRADLFEELARQLNVAMTIMGDYAAENLPYISREDRIRALVARVWELENDHPSSLKDYEAKSPPDLTAAGVRVKDDRTKAMESMVRKLASKE